MTTALALIFAMLNVVLIGSTAGIPYVFSVAIMRAFDDINSPSAIVALQSINRKIQNPVFFCRS